MTEKEALMQRTGCGEFTADRAIDLARLAFSEGIKAAEKQLNLESDKEVNAIATAAWTLMVASDFEMRAAIAWLLLDTQRQIKERENAPS